jgi:hypothetical protein
VGVANATKKEAQAEWYIDDGANDVVGGLGYKTGYTDGKLRYAFSYYNSNYEVNGVKKTDGTKTWGSLYGWSCQTKADGKPDPQEYYVVENFDDNSFVPYDNGKRDSRGRLRPGPAARIATATIDGHAYNLYITRQPNAPHACGTGSTEFYQYWSVRTTKRFAGDISIGDHIAQWSSGTRGFKKEGMSRGYQVMGIEAVINHQGKAAWSVERI